MKLSNFLSVDPEYQRYGMRNGSKKDAEIFQEFVKNKTGISKIADQIQKIAEDPKLLEQIKYIEDDEVSIKDIAIEGQILYKFHKTRERNNEIVSIKKAQVFRKYQKLACESCTFDFLQFYGKIGEGYIEWHHKIPLHLFKAESETNVNDLALVCANCHRILHKNINSLTVDTLRAYILGRYVTGL